MAKENRLDEIDPQVYITCYRTLNQIASDNAVLPPDLALEPTEKAGIWYWGETGVGKTRLAIKEYPDAYRKMANNKWWDAYQGQENVLMDDLDKAHHYMGYHLKIWADRYAFIAEIKGGSKVIRPKKIIVTSNYHPKDIWSDNSTLDPILRRFRVVHVVTVGDYLGLSSQDEQLIADFD